MKFVIVQRTEVNASKYKVATVARPLGFARDWRWSGIAKPGGLAVNPRSGERSYSVVGQSLVPNISVIAGSVKLVC